MSNEVDQRVVEMQFNNAKFEKNVQQSIDSLHALNESLKFEGAEKGFAEVERASEKVDFSRMESALESLNSRFSALEVMGTTALVKITSQAIDAGEKLAKSLSIDQVTAGWSKYAQKTASVQTIMNATGKSIGKVNSYLDKLMWFSDETSYGFTDMTSALSTLTAAGGDIEKMIPMIMGMANATAYAGKGAAEFQRVIYNLAQSYGTGAIQLIDWKSVEQAGVASQQLKQLLIDTGVELGKIKEGQITTGTFDNSLQKKWADREVMEAAFGKYAEFAEAVKAEMDAHPEQYDQASEAMEALADQYDEVTVKAFKAAQEAKSFSDVVDATKDAVSSGWMETFDILFGNYEEAKGFWSDLAEEFWGIFAGGLKGRNNWLKNAFDSGLDQMTYQLGLTSTADEYTSVLEQVALATGALTQEEIDDAGSFQKALENGVVDADLLQTSFAAIVESMERYAGLSDEELKAQGFDPKTFHTIWDEYHNINDELQNGTLLLDDYADKMGQLSGREHFYNGILNILEGINSVLDPMRDAFQDVFQTDGSPLYKALEGFDNLTSKLALSEETAKKVQKVFKGFFSVLSVGFKAVRTVALVAWTAVSKLLDRLSPLGDLLLNIGAGIGDVFTTLNDSLNSAESLEDIADALTSAFEKLVQPLKDIFNALRSLVRGGSFDEAKSQFAGFGTVVNALDAVFSKFALGGISLSGLLGDAVTVLGGVFFAAFEGIRGLIGQAFGGFEDAGKEIEAFKNRHLDTLEQVRDTAVSLPEKAGEALRDFGGSMKTAFYSVADACKQGLAAVQDFFNLKDVDIYRLLGLLDVGALALAIWGVSHALTGMQKALKGVTDAAAKVLSNPVTNLLNSMKSAVDAWTKQHTTNNFVNVAKGISIAVGVLSASVYLLSTIEDPTKAVQALGTVMAALFGLVIALRTLAKADITGLDTAKLFGTIAGISLGMSVLAGAVAKMGSLPTEQIAGGVEAVGHIAAALVGMVGLLSIFNSRLGSVKGASGFVAAAAAIDMIALALIPLAKAEESGLNIDGAVEAINGVALALSILMVASGFAQKLAGTANTSSIDKITKYLVKLGGMLIAINAMGTALLMAAGAVAMLASLGNNLWKGLAGAAVMLAEVGAALYVLSKLKLNPLRMKMAAQSMTVASAALLAMSGAIKLLGDDMTTIAGWASLGSLTIMLAELAGAMYLLGKRAPESMAAAAAMVAMGGALIEMAWAIQLLAGVSMVDLAKGIVTMLASLAVLATGIGWLSASAAGIASLAGSCLMLSTALLLLTPAFKGLATLTLGESLAGVIGIIGMMIGLFAVGAISPVAQGMIVFSACLVSLGKAFSAFAGGLIKLGIASAIFSVLALFAGPVSQAIIAAEPDIEAALIALVTGLCNVINACAEPIGTALATLLKVLIQVCIDLIGWAWDGNGEGGGIKGALEQLWGNLMNWFHEKLSDPKNNPFNLTSWVDAFTADDRPIGWLMNKIFGDDISEAGKGLIDQLNGTGQDMGKNLSEGFANGTEQAGDKPVDAAGSVAQSTLDRMQEDLDEHSPSKKTYEMGVYLAEGLANGIEAPESLSAVENAVLTLSQTAEDGIRNYWGIHSPSWLTKLLGFFLGEGFGEGIGSSESQTAVTTGIGVVSDTAENGLTGVVTAFGDKGTEAGKNFLEKAGSKIQNGLPGLLNKDNVEWMAPFNSIVDTMLGKEDTSKDKDTGTATTTSTGKTGDSSKKSSTSTKQKTAAEQIAETYKTKLKANKTLKDTVDEEYELWQKENQYSASADELLAKKTEHAAAAIQAQSDRVALAQAKYDELTRKWGADKAETKEAYLDLLQEQTSLADLKAEQYTNLFEEVTKRYDTDLDTLEKEYGLWTAQNDKTATQTDKINRETEYMTAELAIKEKKLAKVQEQYDTLKAQYGETDLRTMEAWNDLLDARTEAQELQNELAQQELDLIDAQLDAIQTAQSRMQSRTDLLAKVFDDGDLSGREDAYKAAVEEYGKDSKEAKKAQLQGTTSSILGVVTALKNMNYQMKQTVEYQKELAQYTPGTKAYDNAYSNVLSSQSAFLGFAENLADAFNLEDEGKSIVLKLAYAVQKNWGPLSKAMDKAWTKATENIPEEKVKAFTDALGMVFSDEGIEIGTEFTSAIVSALQGDWAGAAVSAITAALDFASTNEGKQLLADVGSFFGKVLEGGLSSALPTLQTGMGQVVTIFGSASTEITGLLAGGGGLAELATGVFGTISGAFSSLIAVLPEILPFLLVGGAILALLGGIAAIVIKRRKEKKDSNDIADAGKDLDKDFADGITDGKGEVDDAIGDMTDHATDIAAAAISTIRRLNGDEFTYTPQIAPVMDLTSVDDSMKALNQTFDNYRLDGTATKRLAAQVDTVAELQNGVQAQSNAELLAAVDALGDRMDAVGENIRGMKFVVDGKTTLGWIDAGLGARAARRAR